MPDTLRLLLEAHLEEIVSAYVAVMRGSSDHYAELTPAQMEGNVRRSLMLLGRLHAHPDDPDTADYIRSLCEQRATAGFQLGEVMRAIFLLGDVVVPLIRQNLADDPERRIKAEDQLRHGLDRLAELWAAGFVSLHEEFRQRNEQIMRALSTPVIRVWQGILTLPLIGDVDESRSRQVTEELLQTIIDTQSDVVLLDITGIGAIDTRVIAQLVRTVRAAELLGTECCIVGVTPVVANTIVNLGVDLGTITTFADLQKGLEYAYQKLGLAVVSLDDPHLRRCLAGERATSEE